VFGSFFNIVDCRWHSFSLLGLTSWLTFSTGLTDVWTPLCSALRLDFTVVQTHGKWQKNYSRRRVSWLLLLWQCLLSIRFVLQKNGENEYLFPIPCSADIPAVTAPLTQRSFIREIWKKKKKKNLFAFADLWSNIKCKLRRLKSQIKQKWFGKSYVSRWI